MEEKSPNPVIGIIMLIIGILILIWCFSSKENEKEIYVNRKMKTESARDSFLKTDPIIIYNQSFDNLVSDTNSILYLTRDGIIASLQVTTKVWSESDYQFNNSFTEESEIVSVSKNTIKVKIKKGGPIPALAMFIGTIFLFLGAILIFVKEN